MIEEREGVDWSQTHLWKHLTETYAEEVEDLACNLGPDGSQPAPNHRRPPHLQLHPPKLKKSQKTSLKWMRKNQKPRQNQLAEASSDSESSDDEAVDEDWTRTIWELLNILRKSPTFNMRQCGIGQLADELHNSPSFPHNHKAARKSHRTLG